MKPQGHTRVYGGIDSYFDGGYEARYARENDSQLCWRPIMIFNIDIFLPYFISQDHFFLWDGYIKNVIGQSTRYLSE